MRYSEVSVIFSDDNVVNITYSYNVVTSTPHYEPPAMQGVGGVKNWGMGMDVILVVRGSNRCERNGGTT